MERASAHLEGGVHERLVEVDHDALARRVVQALLRQQVARVSAHRRRWDAGQTLKRAWS